MNLTKLEKLLENQPAFRLTQIRQAIFKDLIENWDEAQTLPAQLRDQLKEQCPLKIDAKLAVSKDNQTIKALITLQDSKKVEAVLMKHKSPNSSNPTTSRNSVCVSCQVGCPMGCTFCETGKMGLIRNLTENEILEQILLFARFLKKTDEKITNVTYMGMGEPFMNYDNVMASIRTLNDPKTFNLGARRISVSTCGIIDGIDRLAEENLELNLAISLHAPNDILRTKLMPSNRKYPLHKILQAVDTYVAKTNRKIMFEYLLIKGINDTEENAQELALLMKKKLYMVNLIPYNPTDTYKPSPTATIRQFKQTLEDEGVNVTQRYSYGQDIQAACGQLATEDKS
ncbi:23S rRNA (adenine(2503)-C(2))-methyltransferase RlmN [Candidatus Peregrinibacteria bacterium]|jgi:23S rRNA (adenine2503-C2)-methyltransferase|nr:23S rRNA (adenine(2503)-C(2))-methyltransferase RlmN [Candidatus Peregrinibacteria bacterium]MBT4056248.1 23S rRNA (adenine(2503)-C(2))-methyltransferase RlmN [Candidatus Peregrinibacteria bacterium]